MSPLLRACSSCFALPPSRTTSVPPYAIHGQVGWTLASSHIPSVDFTQASNPSEGVYAAGAHTDYGMFTFLMTDHTPGLQVWRGGAEQEDGSWQAVPPVEGAFIVNLGDMLQRWTNDVFKSTAHRVVIQEATEEGRYSAPFFYEPNFDTLVACLPGFVKKGEVPRHVPVKSGEYLLGKYRHTHRDFVEKADDNNTLENHAGLHTQAK